MIPTKISITIQNGQHFAEVSNNLIQDSFSIWFKMFSMVKFTINLAWQPLPEPILLNDPWCHMTLLGTALLTASIQVWVAYSQMFFCFLGDIFSYISTGFDRTNTVIEFRRYRRSLQIFHWQQVIATDTSFNITNHTSNVPWFPCSKITEF